MTLLDKQLLRLFEPALRGYLLAAAAALAAVFAVKFEDGALAAAGVPVLCGIAGLLLRWTAMPILFVVTLCYFILFPVGLPIGGFTSTMLRASYFHIDDIILAAAALVYLHCQFRLLSLNQQAMPKVNAKDAAKRRDAATIEPSELPRLLIVVLIAVLIGQLLWLLIANVEFHYGSGPLLRWKPSAQELRNGTVTKSMQSWELSRLMAFALGGTLVCGLIAFVFWYWRLATLPPDEARLILLDTRWQEQRRELARNETWRAAHIGHWHPTNANSDRVFRMVSRIIVGAILLGFLIWIVYINTVYP